MTMDEKDTAGVIAPPPLIYLAFILAGIGLDWLWPAPLVPGWLRWPLGGVLIGLGLAIAVAAMLRFRSAGTDVRPHKPSTAVVTDGLYRFTRNPMYVALAIGQAAIAVAADSLWVLAGLAPALAVVRYGVIAREERYLEAKFGREYLDYKARVRRWF
ncbi:MAG: isoprenylcysteine carboxylmethyltransferase family protein [Alphaproteobacteria bacterium]|nr:isoprenylcysteine carboxylmethyltransferase family protein [Alphaproteobacteria bacterium]